MDGTIDAKNIKFMNKGIEEKGTEFTIIL